MDKYGVFGNKLAIKGRVDQFTLNCTTKSKPNTRLLVLEDCRDVVNKSKIKKTRRKTLRG